MRRPGQLLLFRGRGYIADQLLALFQGLMLRAVLFVHHKVDDVHRLTMRLASRAEAIGRVRLVVHLQAWGAVVVEGYSAAGACPALTRNAAAPGPGSAAL